ncbi:hypothetical protein B7463_g5432, partial [Scytalidium lignicola]
MTFKHHLPTQPFIHGVYVDAQGKERLTLRSAVDDSIITGDLQCASAADVDAAVESAKQAWLVWRDTAPDKKRETMLRFADLIVENAERLGYGDSVVTGKPPVFSISYEPNSAASLFRYFAGYTDKLFGDCIPTDSEGSLRIVRLKPLRVCAGINAFNAPLITFAMKAAPAIAAGNVLISKASEMNPFSSLMVAELAIQAGIPPGVLNVLIGTAEAGEALSHHMSIRKISFTGSVAVGRKIQIAAAKSNLKRVTLELGGKSPVIVFEDADLDTAIADACLTSFSLNGQGCVLGMRMYVHTSLAEKFVEGLKARYEAHATTITDAEANPFASPLYHHRQFESVLSFIERGKKEADLITGGSRYGGKGCYIKPAIFYKPAADAEIITKEIFGPVICIDTFQTEEEVIQKANNTEYGLGAYIYTASFDRAIRVSAKIEAGSVAVNTIQIVHETMPYGSHKREQ